MATSPHTLRFAVLCAERTLPAWGKQCLDQLRASGHAEPVLVITASADPVHSNHERSPAYRLYREKWLEKRAASLRRAALPPALATLPQIAINPGAEAKGAFVETVRSLDLDFVLGIGVRSVPRGLLALPRFGVWSYRHDRQSAPSFWEIQRGLATTEAFLERLGADGEPDRVLHRGVFGTCLASWVNSVDRVFFGATDWCARACAEISTGRPSSARATASEHASSSATKASPAPVDLLRFFSSAGAHTLSKLWELLFHIEIWNVGVSKLSVENVLHKTRLSRRDVTWCAPHASRHFIADPFSYSQDGEHHVLVEDYDPTSKGRICTLTDAQNGRRLKLDVDLEFPHHLSYPCIYTEGGAVYCVPEAYQSRRASLYRREGKRWQHVRDILEGLPVVDPTLFKHEERYWLFFTLQDDGAWGNLKLYAYHSERLDGHWQPHLLNPLKCDITCSRPAGSPFVVDSKLYRPSQDCSKTYGGAVVINHIAKLSATEFEEVAAARIEPLRDGPYPDGLHTLNAMGTQSLIDSKKFAFDWLAWRHNWGRLYEVFR